MSVPPGRPKGLTRPAGAANEVSLGSFHPALDSVSQSTQVDQCLQHLILRLDGLGVGLVDTLRRDHVHQLGSQVDVALFERTRLQHPQAAFAGHAKNRIARREGARPDVAALRLQALRIAERGQLDLTGISIEANGIVMARYSNGQSKPAGQIELATFRNPQGLQAQGGNVWARAFSSGDPILGVAGEGSLGVLQSGALEESNVDLTAELVSMITAQRVYQANAQTIKTQDQVLQTLVNLR